MSDAAATFREILRQQHAFARAREIELGPEGRVARWQDNLFQPLGERTLAELADDLCSSTDPADHKPGGLHDLHSTQALICNLVEHWREGDATALGEALAIERDPITSLGFGAPASASGQLPIVDAWLEHQSGRPTAVIASYADAYADVDPRPSRAQEGPPDGWGPLHACRGLATDLRANPRRFARLIAGRLIETAALLTHRYGAHGFRLLHLWHETPGRAGLQHRREIDRLRMRVGGEIQLRFRSWRQVIDAMDSAGDAHAAYSGYLKDRYLASRSDV
jgi:hypothetical protein